MPTVKCRGTTRGNLGANSPVQRFPHTKPRRRVDGMYYKGQYWGYGEDSAWREYYKDLAKHWKRLAEAVTEVRK